MAAPLGELRRILGPVTGVAVCIGMAVGAGILRTPGGIAAQLPSAVWILGVWCLGALIATLDALILAEMAASVPRVGGLVAYLNLSYGRGTAFVVGWSMLLVTWPASLAGVAVATGELLTGGAETLGAAAAPTAAGRTVAAAVIVAIGGVNLIGLRAGARFEVLLFVLKVVLLGGICIAAALAAPAPAAVAPAAFPASSGALLAALGGAMTAVIFSYDGYADAVYLAGETRDPGRAMPRALLTALLTITALYLLANVTFLLVLGTDGLAHSKFAALDVASAAFGPAGKTALTAIALVVMLGAINAYFLTGPRIARVLAEERLALPVLGRVPHSGAPTAAILCIVGLATAFALSNTFDELLEVTVPIISATTALVAVGLLVQRRRAPGRERPFRLRAPWLVVGLQVAIGVVLLVSFVAANPRALAIDLAAVLAGIGVYLVVRRRAAASA
ncbi:MAG TPA: APC family permease [Planctomycetota bacterium]|nr:APC family permease [Planctomycetota bacterium]